MAGILPFLAGDYRTVQQGLGVENCWLISAIVGLSYLRPEQIPGMVLQKEKDLFKVCFPGRQPALVHPRPQGAANVIEGHTSTAGWANLLEAAAGTAIPGAFTWRTITMGRGIDLLTGRGSRFSTNLFFGFGSPWESFHARLTWAAKNRKVVVIGTGLARIKVPGLTPRHCYALLRYDPSSRIAVLRDPYCTLARVPEGRTLPEHGPAAFWLTLDEIQQNYMGMAMEK